MGAHLSLRRFGRAICRETRPQEYRQASETDQAEGRRGSDSGITKVESGECLPKKLKALVLEEGRQVIRELRHEHKSTLLLDIAKLPRSTYCYYIKHMKDEDKYSEMKKQIADIFNENNERYEYRRTTLERHNQGYVINHKTVLILINE